jgi:FkbM family methyltransferase
MKLAYDIGGYDGSDTAHYLSLGYNVVCVEASPDLAAKISARFPREVADGRVRVLNIGVGYGSGTLPFYLSTNPIWNSFDKAMAARAGAVRDVAIPMMPLASVIANNGAPDFVKSTSRARTTTACARWPRVMRGPRISRARRAASTAPK